MTEFLNHGFDDLTWMLLDETEDTGLVTADGCATERCLSLFSAAEAARLGLAMRQARWLWAGGVLYGGQDVTAHPLQLPGRNFQEGGAARIEKVYQDGYVDLHMMVGSGRPRLRVPPETVTPITEDDTQQRRQRQQPKQQQWGLSDNTGSKKSPKKRRRVTEKAPVIVKANVTFAAKESTVAHAPCSNRASVDDDWDDECFICAEG